jgi:hypothetical protein
MRNRAATWVNFVFACIIILAIPFQVYFIASYASGAGEGALDAHGFTGGVIIHGSELLVFLSALVAFWRNWTWIAVCFGLFAFGTIQIFLAPPDEDPASGWVHGLHGLFALIVFLYAVFIAYRDSQWLGLRAGAPTTREAVPPAPPPA